MVFRSLLLEKSNEIIRLKQDNDKYKQRLEKFAHEIKEKDKEITGMWVNLLEKLSMLHVYACVFNRWQVTGVILRTYCTVCTK